MFPLRYDLGFCISEGSILHSHRREYLKSYRVVLVLTFRRNPLPTYSCADNRDLYSHGSDNLKHHDIEISAAVYDK
jgi:hypothetical protein